MSVEWIHFPRIRTFVQKTFSRPLFQKEAFEIWGVPSFPKNVRAVMYPPEWATALLPVQQRALSMAWLISGEKLPETRGGFSAEF